ncbi:sigma-70 family RNA polymerase sigma factor [Kitasatospora sp. NPDC001159]
MTARRPASQGRTHCCCGSERGQEHTMRTLHQRRRASWSLASDEALVEATRQGEMDAYGELWVRYERSALNLAAGLAHGSADDIVAEAFARILRCLRSGTGPHGNFKAYLFATVRSLVIDSRRVKASTTIPVGDPDQLALLAGATTAPEPPEAAELAEKSWRSLNERDQWLMWATAVEGYSTPEIGSQLGITSAKAAVWLYRARERMRDAFLANHIAAADDPQCAAQRRRFGTYLRGRLSQTRSSELSGHLASCLPCADVFADVRDVNRRIRAAVFPLLPGAALSGLTSPPAPPTLLARLGQAVGSRYRALESTTRWGVHWLPASTAVVGAITAFVLATVLIPVGVHRRVQTDPFAGPDSPPGVSAWPQPSPYVTQPVRPAAPGSTTRQDPGAAPDGQTSTPSPTVTVTGRPAVAPTPSPSIQPDSPPGVSAWPQPSPYVTQPVRPAAPGSTTRQDPGAAPGGQTSAPSPTAAVTGRPAVTPTPSPSPSPIQPPNLRPVGPELVRFGGFQQPEVTSGDLVTVCASPTSDCRGPELSGWTVVAGSVDVCRQSYLPGPPGDPSTTQVLDLNGADTNVRRTDGIEQSFPTTSGATYRLRFALAGNTAGSPAVKTGAVSVDGTVVADFAFDITGKSRTDSTSMDWSTRTVEFVARSSHTRIRFTSTTAYSYYGPLITDVSLRWLG